MIWAPLVAIALDYATAVTAVTSPAVPPAAVSAPKALPALPGAGERAPDFVYQSHDYMRRRFHDMLKQGAVLMVFAPTDADLRALESERDAMLARGVVPVAVLDRRDTDVWKVVRRLDLSYSLLADPRGAIATEFGAWDAAGTHATSAWFVVAADGRIRACARGTMPAGHMAATAFAALGLPAEGAVRTAGAE